MDEKKRAREETLLRIQREKMEGNKSRKGLLLKKKSEEDPLIRQLGQRKESQAEIEDALIIEKEDMKHKLSDEIFDYSSCSEYMGSPKNKTPVYHGPSLLKEFAGNQRASFMLPSPEISSQKAFTFSKEIDGLPEAMKYLQKTLTEERDSHNIESKEIKLETKEVEGEDLGWVLQGGEKLVINNKDIKLSSAEDVIPDIYIRHKPPEESVFNQISRLQMDIMPYEMRIKYYPMEEPPSLFEWDYGEKSLESSDALEEDNLSLSEEAGENDRSIEFNRSIQENNSGGRNKKSFGELMSYTTSSHVTPNYKPPQNSNSNSNSNSPPHERTSMPSSILLGTKVVTPRTPINQGRRHLSIPEEESELNNSIMSIQTPGIERMLAAKKRKKKRAERREKRMKEREERNKQEEERGNGNGNGNGNGDINIINNTNNESPPSESESTEEIWWNYKEQAEEIRLEDAIKKQIISKWSGEDVLMYNSRDDLPPEPLGDKPVTR